MVRPQGPFLWFSDAAPPRGFRALPEGGMCVSVFLFVRRGQGLELLVGKVADDPRLEEMLGLDEDRRKLHGQGWTLPATHLKLGEDPRDAARRLSVDLLRMPWLPLAEPRVEVEHDVHPRYPDRGKHFDLWFFVDAPVPASTTVQDPPPWFRELAFKDPRDLAEQDWARSHEDVATRWMLRRRQ